MHQFKNLKVWHQAMELAKNIYLFTRQLPDEEKFGLVNQMKRSSVSVASNIAEGAGRGSDKDFIRFLYMALGSTNEIETQLLLTVKLKMTTEHQIQELVDNIHQIQKMTHSLRKSLN